MGTNEPSNRNRSTQLRDTRFGRWVVEVLRHLHDPGYLKAHPLNQLASSNALRHPADDLQGLVTSTIDELRRSTPANNSAWRGHELLHLFYVQGMTREEVQSRLLIGRSEFHRAQARGQESLVGALAQRWGAAVQDDVSSETRIALGAIIPTPLDKFVGRATEISDIEELLVHGSEARLVTIQGPPGAGKTRLAIELARRLKEAFAGDVFYIPLASVNAPDAVPDVIVSALGLVERGDTSAEESLQCFFRSREALLVLDNLEHLPGAAVFVASLLSAAPRLKVLATSQALLHLSGERTYSLSPLAVPECDTLNEPAEGLIYSLGACEAVQLFVERARAADPTFTFTARNAQAVGKICRQVDGLPLAIELVAARTRSLSVPAILDRLKHRLDLTAGRRADRPPRQQSLRMAIAWSYDLLEADARQLFRCFGIFDGPCSLEAVEAVAGASGVLDALDELIAHSLVRRWKGEEGEPYFEMLVTIREFASEQLRASDELSAVEERFLAHYRALADHSVRALRGPHQIAWANRLSIETPNLSRAITRVMECQPEHALRFVAALGSFWIYRSQLSAGREWSERAMKLGIADPIGTARVRFNAAVIARDQGEVDVAQCYLETSLGEFNDLLDVRGPALCLHFLGLIALQRGNYQLALKHLKASRASSAKINNRWAVGWNLYALGTVYEQQRFLKCARALFERAHNILSEVGDLRGIAAVLSSLGNVQRLLGEFEKSRETLEEALRLQRRVGARSGGEITLLALSGLAHHDHKYATAHQLIDEATQIAIQIGDRRNLRLAHAYRVVVLKSERRFVEALQLAERVLEMAREQGDIPWMALGYATIGDLVERASAGNASGHFLESLRLLVIFKDRWSTARTIALIGLWAARNGRLRDAARALGAAVATQPDIRATIEYSHADEWTAFEADAQACLGLLDAATALAEGKAMGVGRAIAFAQSLLESSTRPSDSSAPDSPYSVGTRSG